MTTQQLQNVIHATPFRPFALHLADGRALNVPHPDFIAHTPASRIAIVTDPGDGFEVVDLLLVVSLQVLAPHEART